MFGNKKMFETNKVKNIYNVSHQAPINECTKYGLFDDDGDLRYVSYHLDGCVLRRQELEWGKIREIEVTKEGVKYGKLIS